MAGFSEVTVRFRDGLQVEAEVGGHRLLTDQPVSAGGQDEGPSPYALFLASIAACAGFYVLRFCRTRGLDASGIRLRQRVEEAPEGGAPAAFVITVEVPSDFPAKYVAPLLRAAEGCSVKRALAAHPAVVLEAFVRPAEPATAAAAG